MLSRNHLGRTISILALAVAGHATPSLAQSTAAPFQTDDAQSAPDAESGSATIGDIVVTAQRRSETVQKSSLAIEVFSAEQMAGVTKPTDITSLTPGVQIGLGGPNPQVYVRGVGDPGGNTRSQGAVPFNVDGVYIARGSAVTPMFFDIARMEVLKGPQGTLYGRNASGGAINIITNRPNLGEVSGSFGAELGNYDLKRVDAAINLPLGSTLAARFSGQVIDRDGYTSNGGLDQKLEAGRAQLLWQPDEAVSLLLRGDVSHIGGIGTGTVPKPAVNGDPWHDATDPPFAFPFTFGAGTPGFTQPNDRFVDLNDWGVSAELNADLGFATLTIIPAYRHLNYEATGYPNNFRFYEKSKNRQTSVETRLGHDSGTLKWTLGGFYYREEQDILFSAFSQGTRTGITFDQGTKAYAAFGEATLSLTSRLRAIGGLRYTKEKLSGQYTSGVAAPPLVAFTPSFAPVGVGPLNFSSTNFKVGVEYDLSPSNMLFATYATGFKGGGFTQTIRCGANVYNPERVNALTLGSRNRFADNRVQLNLEGFYWKYKSQQTAYLGLDRCGDIAFVTTNPGDATLKGANIDLTFKLTSADTFRAAVEYNDATYNSFLITQFGAGAYAPGLGSRCSATPATGPLFNISCAGQQLPRAPKWSGSFGYSHVFDLGESGEFEFNAGMQFASSRWLEFQYIPNQRADNYQVYNAALTYRPKFADLTLTAYVDNISNEPVYTGAFASAPTRAPNGFSYVSATILAPRTYGVRARYVF